MNYEFIKKDIEFRRKTALIVLDNFDNFLRENFIETDKITVKSIMDILEIYKTEVNNGDYDTMKLKQVAN